MNYFYFWTKSPSMIKRFPKILAGLILASLFYSLTLSNYQTITDGMEDESSSFISQYPHPDQSGGFFGGGYYTTYNGLGSIFALTNIGICTLLFIVLLLKKVHKRFVNILLFIFIGSHFLTFLGNYFAGYLLSEPDRLFIGHYWLMIGEICLFTIVYYTKNFYVKRKVMELLDDGI